MYVRESAAGGVVTLTISRPKVNALNDDVVQELRARLDEHEGDDSGAIVLTGERDFFSFGFDVPFYRSAPRDVFGAFVRRFTDLYRFLFLYPKPVVAAINGHAVAGGCMLALACDQRVMSAGKARISLNEVGFGSTVFAGSVEMLRFAAGSREASRFLTSGVFCSADEARAIGIVDDVASRDDLAAAAQTAALELAKKSRPAFASLKRLLREPVVKDLPEREPLSIEEFLDIWYSPATQQDLEKIVIRD